MLCFTVEPKMPKPSKHLLQVCDWLLMGDVTRTRGSPSADRKPVRKTCPACPSVCLSLVCCWVEPDLTASLSETHNQKHELHAVSQHSWFVGPLYFLQYIPHFIFFMLSSLTQEKSNSLPRCQKVCIRFSSTWTWTLLTAVCSCLLTPTWKQWIVLKSAATFLHLFFSEWKPDMFLLYFNDVDCLIVQALDIASESNKGSFFKCSSFHCAYLLMWFWLLWCLCHRFRFQLFLVVSRGAWNI